ncbi:MAG: hypothetical protein ACTSQI_05880 [Candidatus Helarchaeota archaeon]
MIHNLYIISEGGIAIYSKHFAKSDLDEQLISGFILAVGNFAMEAVGSGLKKIEMETGEQLFVYYDPSMNLTAAAITGANDYPKLVLSTLQEILSLFHQRFKEKVNQAGNLGDISEFDLELDKFMKDKTAKRDKKRFFLGIVLGGLLLTFLYMLFWSDFFDALINFITEMENLVSLPQSQKYLTMIFTSGEFSFSLELNLIIIFTPSALLGGYIAGSRSKGKLLGLIFFFVIFLEALVGIILFNQDPVIQIATFLLLFALLIFIPLVMITSIIFSYLGGYLRDRRKLYPIPPDKLEDISH